MPSTTEEGIHSSHDPASVKSFGGPWADAVWFRGGVPQSLATQDDVGEDSQINLGEAKDRPGDTSPTVEKGDNEGDNTSWTKYSSSRTTQTKSSSLATKQPTTPSKGRAKLGSDILKKLRSGR